ncbi:Phosphoenolpyruvate carboxykinase [GTP], mitochondrial [Thelohanellus kitauei]|uniref:Phosphoenolpyruvate carboxykinase [GTP], mitochondrial n=1 Tax=Thelohanellus kitauei TaxID=669202 RepID=A0A0C2N1D6_THEKT|nr:Phosphoenolpyruvate carboxykinase [GTP], mitochondrial [Thelohanellus kitauei]
MQIVSKDTIFTNVCETSDGGIFWEGLENEIDTKNLKFIDWKGQEWNIDSKTKSSHPNSRFCSPITNCPILNDDWDNPRGVAISAIIFGGRRPYGIPLVFQSKDWTHGVLVGSCVKSETTSAASDLKANTVLHDPFSMRPFVGYNCGDYMKHWLEMGEKPGRHIPLIFHVNWFLKDESGNFVWPGFGENSRVLEWILDRCRGVENYVESPIGLLPKKESFNLENLPGVDFARLFHIDKDFWVKELAECRNFFENVINEEFPKQLDDALKAVERAVEMM